MSLPPLVAELMRRQLGVIHRRQAIGCGMPERQIDRLLSRGIWVRVHREVYAAAGAPVTHEGRCWAAWLAVRYAARDRGRMRQVAISGLAAAQLHRMVDSASTGVEISVPLGAAVPSLRGVRVRRLTAWKDVAVTRLNGLHVTSRGETAARLAALLSDDDLVTVVQDEVFHRRLTLARLAARRRTGRAGSARLGRVIALLETGADSAMHARGRSVLMKAGMPRPSCGVELVPGTGETDCFVAREGATGPPYGYVVEFDGARHRLSRRKYRFGLWKRRTLERAGYPVMRFTDDDIKDPTEMINEVLEEDARQRALPPEGDGLRRAG